MLKAIINFFWPTSEADLTLDEAYNILESNNETTETCINTNEAISEYTCFQKTGIITAVDGNNFTIDDTYKFKSTLENLAIGSLVSFTIYTSDGEIKVSDVLIQDDWFCQKGNDISSWCQRSLICKVLKREGRQVYLTPNKINFDLTDVCTEFIPLAGDWVELDVKVELDEAISDLFGKILEIEKMRPLKCYISEGCVKQWCNETQEGVIDRTIFFNHDSLMHGYTPFVGDRIIAEIIESEQGMYNKRALKIIPQNLTNKKVDFNKENLPKFDEYHQDLVISQNIVIRSKRLGAKEKFVIEVCNKSKNSLLISNVSFPSVNSQCILVKPELLHNITIASGQHVIFEGVCTTKYVGTTKELILFTFSEFNIGRWLTVKVELNNENRNNQTFKNTTFAKTRFNDNHFNRIRGQKVTIGPRFVSRRLPGYPTPQKLIDLASKCDKKDLAKIMCEAKPCLTAKFQFNIYEDRFHTLLHLEEIFELEAIKSYSQDYACFIKNGEYLMLEIENLGETRPSLLIGDRIIAKDPYEQDAQEFEGFIHKIEAKHVYLKFAHTFHDEYDGEDVSVMAIASRGAFRRMHQAIGLAVQNLGAGFLFPSKLITKNPQIQFNLNNDGDNEKIVYNNIEIKLPETRSGAILNALMKHINTEKNNDLMQKKLVLEWYNNDLNYYQKEAVQNILMGVARPLPYFIYGPPGTGKTVTLVESILQILRLVQHSRIIVATPSNSAANLIALRLIDSGILKPGELIRLVGYRYIAEDNLPTRLIPYSATADIGKEGTTEDGVHFAQNGITLGCNSSVIGRHRITVGTCSTMGILFSMGFPKGHFTHIIVDEAGQAKEPEIMIPLSLIDVSSGQVILAGDPCQLGPVILSKVALECGLGETYLDRMLVRFPYIRDIEGFPKTDGYDPRLITKLVYNYRSLPDILNMSSKMFYNGQLISTISECDSKEAYLLESLKEILPTRPDLKTPAVVFHGVIGENSQTHDCPSWFNANEASQIFFYVNELYRLGLKSTDIGIISPYLKQVKLIRSLLNEAEFDVPKVGTVEDFQGHEFNVILLTTVRSSENLLTYDVKFHLGFLSHQKRLNVAITRAQALMIIVGNPHLLCRDPHWRSIIKYCMENGAYCGCDLPNF